MPGTSLDVGQKSFGVERYLDNETRISDKFADRIFIALD